MTRHRPSPVPIVSRRPAAWASLAVPGLAVLLVGLLAGCSSASGPHPAAVSPADWTGQTVRPDVQAQSTPIALSVVSTPHTVVAADGFVHLPYEIALHNLSAYPVTVQSITALDADAPRAVIAKLAGPALEQAIAQAPEAGTADSSVGEAATSAAVLAPGTTTTVDIDAFVPMRTTIDRIEHSVSIEWTEHDNPVSLTFPAARTTVDSALPVVVSPPVRGSGWVATAGCCQTVGRPDPPEAVDGTLVPTDRFALDLRKLDNSGRFDPTAAAAAPEPALAVGDATVVTAAPGAAILDLGLGPDGGRYAVYTHLHDIAVRAGDRVHSGQVIGHLAATANPRLGFAVVDRPSLRQARGLPYEFTAFTGLGRVTDFTTMTAPFGTSPVPVDQSALSGPHNRQLPMVGQVLRFS